MQKDPLQLPSTSRSATGPKKDSVSSHRQVIMTTISYRYYHSEWYVMIIGATSDLSTCTPPNKQKSSTASGAGFATGRKLFTLNCCNSYMVFSYDIFDSRRCAKLEYLNGLFTYLPNTNYDENPTNPRIIWYTTSSTMSDQECSADRYAHESHPIQWHRTRRILGC